MTFFPSRTILRVLVFEYHLMIFLGGPRPLEELAMAIALPGFFLPFPFLTGLPRPPEEGIDAGSAFLRNTLFPVSASMTYLDFIAWTFFPVAISRIFTCPGFGAEPDEDEDEEDPVDFDELGFFIYSMVIFLFLSRS